jgi:hypothetical protein
VPKSDWAIWFEQIWKRIVALGTDGGVFWRTLLVKDSTVGVNIADELVAQGTGNAAKVVAVLRQPITAALVIAINLDGVILTTMTIPASTAVNTLVEQPFLPAPGPTITAGQILSWDILASDGSTDIDGVASFTLIWPAASSSSGSGSTPATGGPYDVTIALPGVQPAGLLLQILCFPRPVAFLANFAGSTGHCAANPSATAIYTFYKNASVIGTMAISTLGLFNYTGLAVSFNTGDTLALLTPPADATLLNVTMTLAGAR